MRFSLSSSSLVVQLTRAVPDAVLLTRIGHAVLKRSGPIAFGATEVSAKRIRPCWALPLTLVNSPPITM